MLKKEDGSRLKCREDGCKVRHCAKPQAAWLGSVNPLLVGETNTHKVALEVVDIYDKSHCDHVYKLLLERFPSFGYLRSLL